MFGKINLTDEDGNNLELFVIEQTRINGTDYLLVTDQDDENAEMEVFIVKDLSSEKEEDAVYEFVEDDLEFDSVSKIFQELVDDL